MPGGHREAGEDIFETAKGELQEETEAIKFEIKPICVYSVTGKTRVNDTGEETCGLLCFAEITEFAKELHSEMEKVDVYKRQEFMLCCFQCFIPFRLRNTLYLFC